MNPRHLIAIAASVFILGLGAACQEDPPPAKEPKLSLEVRADGLTYAQGSDAPFTGTFEKKDKDGAVTRSESFKDGKPDGAHTRYYANGKPSKTETYRDGEKIREQRWFENGNPEIDAEMKDGVAFGKHTRWFEDGSLRFEANFIENMQWHGRVRDFKPDGSVIVDAIFEDGQYVKGIFPDAPADAVQEPIGD